MPRRPSLNQQLMIGSDSLLELFVAKFRNYNEAEAAGYGGIYPAVVDWLADHAVLDSDDVEDLLEGYYG